MRRVVDWQVSAPAAERKLVYRPHGRDSDWARFRPLPWVQTDEALELAVPESGGLLQARIGLPPGTLNCRFQDNVAHAGPSCGGFEALHSCSGING